MNHQQITPSQHQAEYARLRALVDIRLAELVRALDAHEHVRSNWQRSAPLAAIEQEIGEALAYLGGEDSPDKGIRPAKYMGPDLGLVFQGKSRARHLASISALPERSSSRGA